MAKKPLSLVKQRPWLRLGGHETERAYAAFLTYRDMPKRTLQAVAEAEGHSDSLVSQWSRKYGWVDRALAWDQHQQLIADNARERAAKRAIERNAKVGDSLVGFGYDQLTRLAQRAQQLPPDQSLLTTREALQVMKLGLEVEARALGIDGPQAGPEHTDDGVEQILERAVEELAQVLPDVSDDGETINMPAPDDKA